MITKCECLQCGQPIEFETSQFEKISETPYRHMGQQINCPSCQQTTSLYMPRQAAAHDVPKAAGHPGIIASILGLIIAVSLGIYFLMSHYASENASANFGDTSLDAIAAGFGLLIYFAPSILGRRKKNARAIFALNILAGWTFIGWVVAMVWACAKD